MILALMHFIKSKLFLIFLLASISSGCNSTQDFSIDVTYDKGFTFDDFYKQAGETFVIGDRELGLLQDVLNQSDENIRQSGYTLLSELEPQISGQFSSTYYGALKNTLFKVFVFNYRKTSDQFRSLVVYFDPNTNELISLTCPENIEQNLSCKNIEYPSDRGGLLAFD